jgi:hypothetical protein
MAALGGTLFKWQHREQRKGGSRVGGHVGVGEEGRGGACTAVDSVGRPAVAPSRWARVAVLLREQGRAVGRGRRGAGETDKRGRAATVAW